MKRTLLAGIAIGIVVGVMLNGTALLAIARNRDGEGESLDVKRLAAIEQNIADLLSANRIQDAHIVNTYVARMRVAEMELVAGRNEHARILATSALTGMIGLYHNACGGAQTLNVPAANIPAALRQFFGEGEPYTITGTTSTSDGEMLVVSFNHPTTC